MFVRFSQLIKHSKAPCVAALVFAISPALNAANPPTKTDKKIAAAKLTEALQAEADGDLQRRNYLLAELSLSSECAPAMWYTGQFRDSQKEWTTIEQSVKEAEQNQTLDQYEQLRAKQNGSTAEQLQLARWCQKNKLNEQAKSHYVTIIQREPNNQPARIALGFVRGQNGWIDPQEIQNLKERDDEVKRSLKLYASKVAGIVRKLSSKHEQLRDAAHQEMTDTLDPVIVPAIQRGMNSSNLQIATAAVDWLVRIDSIEASKSLVQFALWHSDEAIRQHATEALKSRPFIDFVPELLQVLKTPIGSSVEPILAADGQLLGYRQVYKQETFDTSDTVFVSQQFQTSGANSIGQAMLEQEYSNMKMPFSTASPDQIRTNQEIGKRNHIQKDRNASISKLISQVAAIENRDDVHDLWSWWDGYNRTGYQTSKQDRYQEYSYNNDYSDQSFYNQIRSASHECFVAGTPVQTQRGRRAIESLTVGDLVLTRDIKSGELTWKPILAATTRPAEALMTVKLDNEELTCTAGHVFWVSGCGWTKASDLLAGDVLHAASKPSVIRSIQDVLPKPTYNLRVLDNANYFVGESLILSHDATPQVSDRQAVPGERFVSLMK